VHIYSGLVASGFAQIGVRAALERRPTGSRPPMPSGSGAAT
jgi:hypothetical protein